MVAVDTIERDRQYPSEQATIIVLADERPVRLRASRWHGGRWSLLAFDGRYEDGVPLADEALNAKVLDAAARALRIRQPTFAQIDDLSSRVLKLEIGAAT